MALGEKFKFKDVVFDGRIDHVNKKIFFVLSRVGGSEYASVDLKLHLPDRKYEDFSPINFDKNLVGISRSIQGICFHGNCGTVKSPHSIERLANFFSTSLTNSFKSISKYETVREASLSSSLQFRKFPDRMSKWFTSWCISKIKERIYSFVNRGCLSLLSHSNLDDLERQRFFTSAFSASNWDNLMTSDTMVILHHRNMPCSDSFKSVFDLPVSRKCLLDACIVDGKILFRKMIVGKNENFFIAISDNKDPSIFSDAFQYYDNWKSYLVMSDSEKDLNLVERCIPFMKYNFSFCYLNSFQYIHPSSKIESHLDFKTALSISSAVGEFYLRCTSDIDISELRCKFKDIYDKYLLDKDATLCKIHKAYSNKGSLFTGTIKDMQKSLPCYSSAWSNYLEEQIFVKESRKAFSNNTLDEEMELF